MSLSEFELKRCEYALAAFLEKRRPPTHLRKEVDLRYRIEGQSVEIFEVRPGWRNPENTMELPISKAIYVKSRGIWKVYYKRGDLKWHLYDPTPEVDANRRVFRHSGPRRVLLFLGLGEDGVFLH